ncbi:hypothetical protein INT44_001696 [Umbelopsis vinacea]|uniref:Cyclin N-terminal domain-containing protein n=1 Tax=Umbelopsis vinacea TaxID=44442 RepID=A0A8H7PRG1_9FUNG|nr:hypothetical protein INT44_001696 [Umbelopsis vinacea]
MNNRPSRDKSKSTDPDNCLRRTASRPCFKYQWQRQREEQDKAAYQRHCAERLASVYNGNTTQAILFLKAIKANNREPMQPFTIPSLAADILKNWEGEEPNSSRTAQLAETINNLLTTTAIKGVTDLDAAIVKTCANRSAMPVACPTTTMMVAICYIQRLKRKYHNVKGARGCSQRLLLVAYMISAKYIHACLRTIVDSSEHQQAEPQQMKEPVSVSIMPSVVEPVSPQAPKAVPVLGSAREPDSPPASPPMASAKPPQPTAAQLYRMELEFLHFLDYDLLVPNPCALIDWWYRCVRDHDASALEYKPDAVQDENI